MSAFIRALFKRLDDAGIGYCVLRNYQSLPDDFSHDIDMQIELGKMPSFVHVLLDCCNETGWYCVRFNRRLGYHFFALSNGEDVIPLDVWMPMMYHTAVIVSPELSIESRTRYRDFWVAAGGIEVANSLLKEVLFVGKVKDKGDGKDKERYQELLRVDEGVFVQSLEPYLGQKMAINLKDWVLEGQWSAIESSRDEMKTLLFRLNQTNSFWNKLKMLSVHLQDRWLYASYFKVCFIGPDGSGKTTALTLFKEFADKVYDQSHVIHGHFHVIPELKSLKNLFSKRKAPEGAEEVGIAESSSPVELNISPAKAWVNVLYYSIDYALGHFAIMKRQLKRVGASVFLWDRYYYDYILHKSYRCIPSWLHAVHLKIIPRPHLLIFLECDADLIFARKPELKPEDIQGQQAHCEKLVERFSGVKINTSRGLEDSNKHVIAAYLKDASRRTLKRLNQLYS